MLRNVTQCTFNIKKDFKIISGSRFRPLPSLLHFEEKKKTIITYKSASARTEDGDGAVSRERSRYVHVEGKNVKQTRKIKHHKATIDFWGNRSERVQTKENKKKMGIELAGSILHNSAEFVLYIFFCFLKAAIAFSGPVWMSRLPAPLHSVRSRLTWA